MKKLLAAAALAACAHNAAAEEFDINIGEDSVRGALSGPLSRVFSGVTGQYDAGVIYKDGKKNPTKSTDTQLTLLHAGALATGSMGATGADAAGGLGARVILADRENITGAAVALGGQFEVRMPGFERIGFTGYGYFAPDILSFSEVKNYSEFALDVEFEVVRAAAAYVGYRQVNVKPDPSGPAKADDGFHVGLRLSF